MDIQLNISPEFADQIADKVLGKLLPFFQDQKPPKAMLAIDRGSRKEKKDSSREYKPRMLSVSEAASYLGIAEKTLRNRMGKKIENPFPIKPKRIGGRVLFDRKDLDVYIDSLPAT